MTLCSFCGKSQAEVKKIIAGPGVYICDSCVNVCKTIIDREVKTPTPEGAKPAFRLIKPGDIKKVLDDHVIGRPGPVTVEIQQAYLDTVQGRSDRWSQWLEYAPAAKTQA